MRARYEGHACTPCDAGSNGGLGLRLGDDNPQLAAPGARPGVVEGPHPNPTAQLTTRLHTRICTRASAHRASTRNALPPAGRERGLWLAPGMKETAPGGHARACRQAGARGPTRQGVAAAWAIIEVTAQRACSLVLSGPGRCSGPGASDALPAHRLLLGTCGTRRPAALGPLAGTAWACSTGRDSQPLLLPATEGACRLGQQVVGRPSPHPPSLGGRPTGGPAACPLHTSPPVVRQPDGEAAARRRR
jgi:hypothetical protein